MQAFITWDQAINTCNQSNASSCLENADSTKTNKAYTLWCFHVHETKKARILRR